MPAAESYGHAAVEQTVIGAICLLSMDPRPDVFDLFDRDLLRHVSMWLGANGIESWAIRCCAPPTIIWSAAWPSGRPIRVVLGPWRLPARRATATRRILDRAQHVSVIGISAGADEFVTKAMKGAGAVAWVEKERLEDLCRAIDDAVVARLQAAHPWH